MSLTEKTDIRDSDEKVVEIEMERLDKKKCSSQFTLSSDCIRRFCEKYREARIILISSWKNGFISSHNEKNTPQIKELEAQLDRYGEYYGAAEPPVRCGESHLSGLTEPLRSL